MNCDIIKDLLPLYIDECCSEDSKRLVEEHIGGCADCRRAYNEMRSHVGETPASPSSAISKLSRVNEWRASVVQSAALFASFALIVLGVSLEAATPAGPANGAWLFALIIPATAFLLSLVNLYFIRFYKSKKSFVLVSLAFFLALAAVCFIWGMDHYGVFGLMRDGALSAQLGRGLLCGAVLTAVLAVVSLLLSRLYARSLGKE